VDWPPSPPYACVPLPTTVRTLHSAAGEVEGDGVMDAVAEGDRVPVADSVRVADGEGRLASQLVSHRTARTTWLPASVHSISVTPVVLRHATLYGE